MRWLLLSSLLVVGCSSKSVAPTVVPVASATPAAEETTAQGNGPCLARTAREAPAGWTRGGTIAIAVQSGRPTKLTLVDAGGKTLASETPVDEKDIAKQITSLTCRAGTWLAIPGAPPPRDKADAEVTFALYRPAKSDEAADVALLCTMPREAADPSADESQRAAIAAEVYSERLSTVRYRSWFYELDRELGAAQSDTDRITVKQRNGTKLASLLKASKAAPPDCWFAKVLNAAKR